jgi:hypothetical protein
MQPVSKPGLVFGERDLWFPGGDVLGVIAYFPPYFGEKRGATFCRAWMHHVQVVNTFGFSCLLLLPAADVFLSTVAFILEIWKR